MSKMKVLRVAAGLSQAELGAKLGVTQSSVAFWETGAGFPRVPILIKLADILGCTVDELLRSEE